MATLTAGRPPVRLTSLVGRASELRDVRQELATTRLLTLTGPGGTGKTRLALAAAAVAGDTFPGGVCWVELAPAADPASVGQTVASQLGAPDTPGQDAAEAIAAHVSGRRTLIVLDNCEHLAAAVAGLAERLLVACPALSILATSREPLSVEGECSWPVPPLSLPPGGTVVTATAAALGGSDAVRLFEQRAQLVRPSFRVTDDNAAAVLQICRRLDGLPLAIELAAARIRISPAAQLAERLDDIFAVLTGGARTAPRRHQALRATLDWSYDLLTADERAVFRRLAVFSGSFTLPAAEQVAAGGGIAGRDILDLLTRLAEKSLLRAEQPDGGARYHLLATIRDYARERLAGTAEEEPARRAHLRYFTDLAEQAGPLVEQGLEGLEKELDRLDTERPNLRTALEFARQSGRGEAALRLAGQLGRYAYLRGHYHEIRQWMDQAVLDGADAPAALRAKALLGSGRLALLQCDYAPAVRRLHAALRLYRELGDPGGIASALQVLGSVAREQGSYARSARLHAESLAIAAAAGDRRAVASAHGYLGFVSWLQGGFGRATEECTAALEQFRELGDVEGTAWSLLSLGTVARYEGDAERAADLLGQSRSLSMRIGFREGIAWSLEQLGLLAAGVGDPGAGALFRHSLALHRELRDRWRMCSVLDDLAAVALAGGDEADAQRAAGLLGAAEAMREVIGTVIAPCERAQHDQTVAGARAALGAEAFAAAWRRGRLAQPDDLAQPARPRPEPPPAPAFRTRGPGPGRCGRRRGRHAGDPGAGHGHRPGRGRGRPDRSGLGLRQTARAAVPAGHVGAADQGADRCRAVAGRLAPATGERPAHRAARTSPRARRSRLGGLRGPPLRPQPGRPRDCDVSTFRQALAAARGARPAADALPDLQRAVAAYGGEFLAGMPAGEWAQARREELGRAFESALLAVGRLQAAAGRYQAAAAAFRRVVTHEPLNESAHRELMLCWERLGETARAVRHYEQIQQMLREQVGVPPAAETTALYERLLAAR